MNMDLQFVLENEIARWQCNECYGIWFKFETHDETHGFYRLSPVAPTICSVCCDIDSDIESKAIFTSERWITKPQRD